MIEVFKIRTVAVILLISCVKKLKTTKPAYLFAVLEIQSWREKVVVAVNSVEIITQREARDTTVKQFGLEIKLSFSFFDSYNTGNCLAISAVSRLQPYVMENVFSFDIV